MPLNWIKQPMREGHYATLGPRGLTLYVSKIFDATSRGPEEWLIHSLTRSDTVHVSGLEGAQAKAEELAREQLVGALAVLLSPSTPHRQHLAEFIDAALSAFVG